MTALPGERTNLVCPDCGAAMPLVPNRWRPGTMHYRCVKGCCTHGAHSDGRPHGVPADAETRRLRVQCHELFDRMWKNKSHDRRRGRGNTRGNNSYRMSRTEAYQKLADIMELPLPRAHISLFDAVQCRTLIERLDDHQKG